jgi:GNAT superfamily N-acetyltransferase
MADQVLADPALVTENIMANPAVDVLIADYGGEAVGFAIYFYNFSSFLCRPGLYLEDLYVTPQKRGLGIGKALLTRLAAIAVEKKCGRFEWSVLNWNKPAIDFYRRLGAQAMDEWTVYRFSGPALLDLAAAAQTSSPNHE